MCAIYKINNPDELQLKMYTKKMYCHSGPYYVTKIEMCQEVVSITTKS